MGTKDFKISIEKSWGFTYQVLILIILGIVVIAGVLILAWQLTKTSPISPISPLPSSNQTVTMPQRTEEEIKEQSPELRVPAIGIEIKDEEE